MKLVAAGGTVLLMLVLALATATTGLGVVLGMGPATGAAASWCLPDGTNTNPTEDAPGPRLDANQRGHARVIVAAAARMGLPRRAAVIAIATAYQESRLRNLAGGHRDSLGLFQQRPSAGWGSPQQLLTPAYAARAFYQRLVQVPGWQQMPLTRAAQAVQHSAYPDAYARWATLARRVVTRLTTAGPQCAPAGSPDSYPPQDMLPGGLTPRTARVKTLIERYWDEHRIGGYCPGGCSSGHVPGSDHYDGHAIDVMILPYTDPARVAKGRKIAGWLVAHARPLAIKTVIYRDRIRTRDKGWHSYTHPSGNTTDPTLRHLDHIHISVF